MKINVEDFLMYNGIIIVITLLFLYLAYQKGFMRQVLDLLSLIASYFISGIMCSKLAELFPLYKPDKDLEMFSTFTNSIVNSILWFILLIIAFRIIYYILLAITKGATKIKTLSFINKFLGLGLGIVKMVLVLIVLTLFLQLPFVENGKQFIDTGVLRYVNEYILTMI